MISVIVATHHRPASLLRLIEALGRAARDRPVEVIVVADGCTDDTVERARAIRSELSIQVIDRPGPRGAAASRNEGARAANGDLLVFLDDDIEPYPELLDQHLAAHRALGEPAVVVGPPIPARPARPDFDGLSAWGWWEALLADLGRPGHRFSHRDLLSGNCSIPRAAFERLGGFDESFAKGREDTELGARVIAAGIRLTFSPRARAWHHELRSRHRLVARKRAEGEADVRLAELHPTIWRSLAVSAPEPRLGSVLGLLSRAALAAGWAADPVVRLASRWLGPLEWLRMRETWRNAQAAVMYYWYWRAAGARLGGRAGLRALRERRSSEGRPARPLPVDLWNGLGEGERALDRDRPAAARLTMGPVTVGVLPAVAGAEPLAGRHLREAIAENLHDAYAACLALRTLIGEHPGWTAEPDTDQGSPAPATGPQAAEVLASLPPIVSGAARRPSRLRRDPPLPWRLAELDLAALPRSIDGCAEYGAARVLVRHRERPIGFVLLPCQGPSIRIGTVLEAARTRLADGLRRVASERELEQPGATTLPPISVVICSRDRPDSLRRCLAAIARLEHPDFEVVVVDNAPTTRETERVVRDAGVRYEVEPRPGLDRARNRGVAAARHGIVAFTDDDTEVDPGWLSGLAGPFLDPTVDGVTGLVLPAAIASDAEHWFEIGYGGMGKGLRRRRFDGARLSAWQLLSPHLVGVGANMAFRKELLEALGGFDPALDVGTPTRGGGDLDLIHRALALGRVIQYQPTATLRHHHRKEVAALRRQHRDNGRGFGAFLLAAWRRRTVPRRVILWYSLRVWLAWLVGRVALRVLGREAVPLRFWLAEIRGACEAPFAYFLSRRSSER